MKVPDMLIIGDTHIPYEHKNYLDFCVRMKKRYRIKDENVYHIGDIIDNHAVSYHEHEPELYSAGDELTIAIRRLGRWYEEFPQLKVCIGNHDDLYRRKCKTIGLPERVIKEFRQIIQAPTKWEFKYGYEVSGIKIFHGTGLGGDKPHVKAVINNRQSCIIGHCHSVMASDWLASDRDLVFGMSVGCGVDRSKLAFAYGRFFQKKPIISVGLVLDNATKVFGVPMNNGSKIKWI